MKVFVRCALILVGTLSLALGVLGIVLPLVPTTPLFLLAAACYIRSSERLYRWLLSSPWLGPFIRDYREGLGIPPRVKATVLIVLWMTVTGSALLLITVNWVRVLLFLVAAAVSCYLLSIKSPDGKESCECGRAAQR